MIGMNRDVLILAASLKNALADLICVMQASGQTDVAKQLDLLTDAFWKNLQEGAHASSRSQYEIRMLSAYKEVQAVRNLIRFIHEHRLVELDCTTLYRDADDMVNIVKLVRKNNPQAGQENITIHPNHDKDEI